jgi:hypothetical protein
MRRVYLTSWEVKEPDRRKKKSGRTRENAYCNRGGLPEVLG